MNILLVAAEVSPFAKAGGLADVTSYLPIEWKKMGHNPIVIMPKYSSIDIEKYGFKPTFLTLYVPMGLGMDYAHLWVGTLPNSDVPVYLIEHDVYFNRNGIYGDPYEYSDNDRRFIFLSRAVFEAAKALNFKPDVLHSHDYHTAFAQAFLKTHYVEDPMFADCKGVFTIHNLAYQGKFNPYRAMDTSGFGMKEFYPGCWFEMDGVVNAMKIGIMFSDKITTVSPNYSKEIRMPYFSEGLQGPLNYRSPDLVGILNGVFYEEWNPETDEYIDAKFSIDKLAAKKECKHSFLKSFGLDEQHNLDAPLFGIVSRLVEQKGIDLVREKLEYLINHYDAKIALLGSGETEYVEFFNYIKWKYPNNAIIKIGYDNQMSHRIIAASDFILMPSRFEPCGLTQMYALKYGTVPIARTIGGLLDTVVEYNPISGEGWGFTFFEYTADEFQRTLDRAMTYYNSSIFETIRKNGMNLDFSSQRSAKEYIDVFEFAKL